MHSLKRLSQNSSPNQCMEMRMVCAGKIALHIFALWPARLLLHCSVAHKRDQLHAIAHLQTRLWQWKTALHAALSVQ